MSATVHPPSNQQKFWPLKKFALGKSTHTNSAQNKASLGPGDKKTKKSSNSNKPPPSAAATAAETTTKTTLVTLSKQKDTSSISLQRRRGEKGLGTPVNDTSSIVSKKQDQGNVTLGESTTQRSRQRASSPQSNTVHLSGKEPARQQQQTHTLSRRSSLKPTKKDVAYHQQQQKTPTEDIQMINTNTNTISNLSAPKPSLSPVTTMPTIAVPSIESIPSIANTSPRPLIRSNTFTVPPPPPSNPPAISTFSDTNEPAMIPMATKPQQKLMRPTSCTSLRQMALHQTAYPPSPKSRHHNSQDYYYQHQQQYPQHIIKRSSTFNQMSPPGSSYRRSSESTLEDSLMTPNNEDDYEISGQDYHIEDGCYYEDDEQTIYSNNFLIVDPNKLPPPPSPPARRILKRPVSMICQRPPDSLYVTEPSSHRHLSHQQYPQQNQYLHHHHHHHPGVVTVGGAGDLCIPSSSGSYHQDEYYFTSHDNSVTSPVPTSPGSTDSGSGHDLHRQQYQHQANHQPLYVFPDPSSFNEKHPKRNSLQQVHHHQAQHHHTNQHQPQQFSPQQKLQQQQQQQQKSQGGSSHQRHHLSLDLLKQELESEPYNKDISYLCQNVDKLTKDGKEWKTKYEQEKAEKQKHQDDLLAAMNKFSEATEQIRQLSNEKQRLKIELDSVNNQLILEKSKKPTQPPSSTTIAAAATSFIEHHQNPPFNRPDQHQQIKLIQNTMAQLLQLDIFGDMPIHLPRTYEVSNGTSKDRKSDQDKEHQPGSMARTSSILSSASGNQSPRKSAPRSRSSSSKPTTHDNPTTKSDNCSDAMPTTSTAETPDSPSHQHSFLDTGLKNTLSSTNLDAQLQSLLQEKELLQAEYSKIPVSGGNAICRRRREDLESRLDEVDSKMRKIRLRIKRRHKKGHFND